MGVYPAQKVSTSEKEANDGDWAKKTIDFHIDSAGIANDLSDLDLLYEAAAGRLKDSAYKYVLNPFNSEDENLKNYPAKLRNYDIIGPVLKLFLGEKSGRPSIFQVIVTNDDVTNRKKDDLSKRVLANMAQMFVNALNDAGIPTNTPSQEVPDVQEVIEDHDENWNDQRAILGQEALDYIVYNCNMDDKKQDMFFDWLVSGRAYSYKEVYRNDCDFDVVPPHELKHGTTSSGFVEDADWAVRRNRMSVADILDRWRDDLNKEALSWLESVLQNGNPSSGPSMVRMDVSERLDDKLTNDIYINRDSGSIDVWHVQWKTWVKIGILKYQDEYGFMQEMEVDEKYTLDKAHGDIEIEWQYINRVWEGWRLGQFLYVGLGMAPVQRDELNNSSKCKLSYNGRIDKFPSVVRTLINYQALYNIYHYRSELTLARNKDKIMLMAKGMIPEGMAPEKFMHFVETSGIAWFDETKPNAEKILQAIRGIDMGLGTYIAEMRALLNDIKMEAWDAVGLNRQRYGDSKASDGKGVTEQAIFRSAVISEETFRRFEKLEESDHQGLLDISKVAFVDGKKASYINSDERVAFLNINGIEHLESDYGVFAKNSAKEAQKLNDAKQAAFMAVQKGNQPFSSTLAVISANNFSKLRRIVKKAEEAEKQYQQAIQKQGEEAAQNLQAMKNQNDDANRKVDLYKADRSYAAAVDSASIKVQGDLVTAQMSSTADNVNPLDEHNKALDSAGKRVDALAKSRANALQQALQAATENNNARLKERDLDLKEAKMKSDEKIARINPG